MFRRRKYLPEAQPQAPCRGWRPQLDDHPRAERYAQLQEEACDLAKDLRRKLGEIAMQQHTELKVLRAERDVPPLPDKARPLPTV